MRKVLMILLTLIVMISGNAMGQTPNTNAFLTYPFVDYQSSAHELLLRHAWYYDGGCDIHLDGGMDYDFVVAPFGDPVNGTAHVVAAANGRVETNGYDPNGYGNYIVIEHVVNDSTYTTIYGHLLEESPIPVDAYVQRGQFLGWLGSTGYSTGPHLHFELNTENGIDLDPYKLYARSDGWDCANGDWTNCYPASDDCAPDSFEPGMHNDYYWTSNSPSYPDLIIPGFTQAGLAGWMIPEMSSPMGTSQAFLDAYNNWIKHENNPGPYSLGVPYDQGGGVYVHEFYGMYIQDFYGPGNWLDHPYSALIKSPYETDNVYLLKEGFWSRWMEYFGWYQYGYPIDDEEELWLNPVDGLEYTVQKFSEVLLAWRSGNDILVFDYDGNIVQDASFTCHNNTPLKVAGDGIYHADRFVADFDQSIRLIQGETFTGLYAMIGGTQYDIDPFTVTGDMIINVGGEEDVPELCMVGTTSPSTIIFFLAIDGNYAYLATNSNGMKIVDISDPTNPTIVGSVGAGLYDVFVDGNYAYIATHSEVYVVDISNPTSPVTVGSVDTDHDRTDRISVSGDYAYVAYYNEGMATINISDPTNPTIVDFLAISGGVYDIFIDGNYAYVATLSGMGVIDISDPASPVIGNLFAVNGGVNSVFIDGNYAYVASGAYGMNIIDISDPASPVLVTSVDVSAYIVFLDGNYAYVTSGPGEMNIIDISDPNNPTIVESVDIDNGAWDIVVDGNYVYTANSTLGFIVLQKDCGTIAAVSTNFVGGPVTGDASLTVDFSDYSTGYPTSWAWDFGDGSTSTVQNPSHIYTVHGTYSVSLAVDNGASTDSKIITDMIIATKYIDPEDDDVYPHQTPNPFNPVTIISYKLDESQYVKLEIFDVRGRRVVSLVDQVMGQGIHQARFDGRSHASGVYFYRLTDSSGIKTRKMLLLK